MVGELHKNDIGRWEIVCEDGRVELSSGNVCEVKIGETWHRTRIESRSSPYPPFTAEYYAVLPGVRLYEGMPARIE